MKFAFMTLKFNLGVVLNILIYSIKKKNLSRFKKTILHKQ